MPKHKSNEMIEIKTNRILREYSAFSHKWRPVEKKEKETA